MVSKKAASGSGAKKSTVSNAIAQTAGALPPVLAPVMASSFALGFIVVCLVVYLLHIAAAIMIPFVIAVCLWYLINAIARGMASLPLGGYKLPRFMCLLMAILSIVVGVWFVLDLINNNLQMVRAAIPQYQQRLEMLLPGLLERVGLEKEAFIHDLRQYINLTAIFTTLVATFTGLAGKTLVVMFYTGFLLYEQRFFNRKIVGMIEDTETETRVRHILKNIDIKIQRYIWVKVVVSGITGVLTYLALAYFKVDFNQFWGLMAFVLNFIPYIGSLLAIAMPSIIALIQFGDDLSLVFSIFLTLCAIQITLGSIIDPRMLGDSLNISPIMIIFSLAAWGMIWGVPGMFLSIPILAMVVITLGQFPKTRPIAILLSKTGELDRHEAEAPPA
ncbi:MAG: AI-2E family transporter [Alphaproteobacteria bacterium]|nr:AI-2E family transporter [Alphaproteobacteria bacterium]